MPPEIAPISHRRQLKPLGEVFSISQTNPNSSPKFLYTKFCFVTPTFDVYFGRLPIPKTKMTFEDIKSALKLVPDSAIYPKIPAHLLCIQAPVDEGEMYIKRPRILDYDKFTEEGSSSDWIPRQLLQEACTLELLQRNPHPNIVNYHGCIFVHDRIVGLALDKYAQTLEQRVAHPTSRSSSLFPSRPLDVEICMQQIRAAVMHLHSLGLAHNDLNPMNVMLDEGDRAVLIDFGSCQPVGQRLMTAGTSGWYDEMDVEDVVSKTQHDEFALGEVAGLVGEAGGVWGVGCW
ncbi:hypothetical protein K491DRAFT_684560 [Lophiostoma macrostomum CBS 122681]|uniref:Protein kinase domain-containing protein n=1 Tax=Lophiostoma macrostomum CBS 122681 TaxID=1314788 RepID=A0A6A6SPS2_9PLEO|nr:hypothetical protein K491DRAFT_684560 [Lophiostoma macrostomum CBS 122681]